MAIATALLTPNGAHSKRWVGAREESEWTPAALRDVVGAPLVADPQTDTAPMSAMQYFVEVGRALQEYQGLSYAVQDRAPAATQRRRTTGTAPSANRA